MAREELECDLVFQGFLVMENHLKPVSESIIKHLNCCKIKTVMATGDNLLTAVNIARQCSIISTSSVVTYLGDMNEANDSISWNQVNHQPDPETGADFEKGVQEVFSDEELIQKDEMVDQPWKSCSVSKAKISIAITGRVLDYLMGGDKGKQKQLSEILEKA